MSGAFLTWCAAYTEQYQRFVDEALSCGLTDTSVMAAQMITQLGLRNAAETVPRNVYDG